MVKRTDKSKKACYYTFSDLSFCAFADIKTLIAPEKVK